LSDNFPIQNGLKEKGALSPLLFNFALEYAIRILVELPGAPSWAARWATLSRGTFGEDGVGCRWTLLLFEALHVSLVHTTLLPQGCQFVYSLGYTLGSLVLLAEMRILLRASQAWFRYGIGERYGLGVPFTRKN
jgi:hypothetical protein